MLTAKEEKMLRDAVENDGTVVVLRRENRTRDALRHKGYLIISYKGNIGSACQCEITDAGRDAIAPARAGNGGNHV
jgi:hypothetical protein